METQEKFCICFSKIKNFYSAKPKLPLILKVALKPSTKKLILTSSTCDDELLSKQKIITFLAMPLPKLNQSLPSNAIP